MSVEIDPTADLHDFPGRDELEQLLLSLLPHGWIEAVRSADDSAIQGLKRELHNPTIVAELGAAGWVAPHYDIDHGGRGLTPGDAREALTLLSVWEVPHVPRGSGLPLAAPTIQQWTSDETKRRLLPPLLSGEERWCQLFSEPGAGSDMASLATTAIRDGDEWVVCGAWSVPARYATRSDSRPEWFLLQSPARRLPCTARPSSAASLPRTSSLWIIAGKSTNANCGVTSIG